MKNMALTLALLFVAAGSALAQVKVEVLMDQDEFLAHEQLPVKVRVSNNSGQTLLFGDDAWLSFSVEAKDGSIVVKTGDAPMPHNFDIQPAQWASARADIAPYFTLVNPGRYSVKATVRIKAWNKEVTSAPKFFDVVAGTRFWDQAFGLPQSPTNHNAPEVRKYILQQITMERDLRLYFQLTDASEARTYRMIPIGRLISFSDPQTRLDAESNLHLLFQQGARSYSYYVFSPYGDITTRQSYVYINSAPHLKVDDTGKVVIQGGARKLADTDIPSTRKSSLANDVPPHSP